VDLKAAFKNIEEGIKNISSNEEWKKFLAFQSRFYNYSFQNAMLIYHQRPSSTFVAGYNAWKQLGRYVKKGEKAIRILAPCKYKKEDDEGYTINGFRVVSVFDLEQTDGDDSLLPVLVKGLQGSDVDDLYQRLIDAIEIPVTEKAELPANGQYFPATKEIFIKEDLSSLQRVKTLVHEYAHHLHHTKYLDKESRGEKEIVAESAAFITCSHWELDTSDYSLPYLKTWLDDPKQFKQLGTKINIVASEIIGLLEDKQGAILNSISKGA
jgi:antirestriction protein ArdC